MAFFLANNGIYSFIHNMGAKFTLKTGYWILCEKLQRKPLILRIEKTIVGLACPQE